MKILSYYPRALVGDGGPTFAVRGWARALGAEGCEVRVLCEPGPSPEDAGDVEWVPLRHVGKGRLRRPDGRVKAHLRWADVLVLHSAWVLHNVVLARAARRLGVPYVLVPHGGYDPNVLRRRGMLKRAWWRTLERPLLVGASAVHIFFEAEAEPVRSLGFRGPFVVAPNGIDVPPQPAWDGGTGGYVLWLGRYDIEHKGLDLLFQALARMPEVERPVIHLHGKDHRVGRATVAGMVERLRPWVQVAGPVFGPDKRSALVRAKAFVYPSRWDAHSVAVLEALSEGVPCVVTDRLMMAPELAQARAAFVVPATPQDIAGALRSAVGAGAAAVGANGYTFCAERFGWPTVARAFIDQLAEVLRGSG